MVFSRIKKAPCLNSDAKERMTSQDQQYRLVNGMVW